MLVAKKGGERQVRITKIDAKKELFSDKKIRVAAYARVSKT